LIDKKIQKVLSRLQKQAEYETLHEEEIPHSEQMLSITKNIGLFYNTLLRAIEAKKILELGTSVGYSTLWLADAILANHKPKDAVIITIENDSSKIQRAKKNFEDAGINHAIRIKKGNAKDILSEMSASKKNKNFFDFIFIDVDKERYIEYFDLCLPMIKIGGIIGADNILYPERFRPLMKKYVTYVRKIPTVQSTTIPIDNGEEITIKIT
jgi:predicted O-methyltransferase YrrM